MGIVGEVVLTFLFAIFHILRHRVHLVGHLGGASGMVCVGPDGPAHVPILESLLSFCIHGVWRGVCRHPVQ